MPPGRPAAARRAAAPDPELLTAAISAAQQGDDEAFRLLYRAAQPLLLRYLRTLVADDAEDVASQAWLQIARDLSGFTGDYTGFRGWAATIARHRAMDHLRRTRRRPATAVPVERLTDLPALQDTAIEAADAVATESAVKLISRLPRDQAEAVLLRTVMGLDAPTAARVLGKRPGAVRTAAYRGLKRLAELLEQRDSAGPATIPTPRRSGEARRESGNAPQSSAAPHPAGSDAQPASGKAQPAGGKHRPASGDVPPGGGEDRPADRPAPGAQPTDRRFGSGPRPEAALGGPNPTRPARLDGAVTPEAAAALKEMR